MLRLASQARARHLGTYAGIPLCLVLGRGQPSKSGQLLDLATSKLLFQLALYGYAFYTRSITLKRSTLPSFPSSERVTEALEVSLFLPHEKVRAPGHPAPANRLCEKLGDLGIALGAQITFADILSRGALERNSTFTTSQVDGYPP